MPSPNRDRVVVRRRSMATRPDVAGDPAAEHVGARLDELVPLDALEPLASASSTPRLAPRSVAASPAASEDLPVEQVGAGTHDFVPLASFESLEVELSSPCVAISRTQALRGPWAAAALVALGAGVLLLLHVDRAASPTNKGLEAAAPMPRAVSGGRGGERDEPVTAGARRRSTAVRRRPKSPPRQRPAGRRQQPLQRPSALRRTKPEAPTGAVPRTPPAEAVASPPACEFEPCGSTEASP